MDGYVLVVHDGVGIVGGLGELHLVHDSAVVLQQGGRGWNQTFLYPYPTRLRKCPYLTRLCKRLSEILVKWFFLNLHLR